MTLTPGDYEDIKLKLLKLAYSGSEGLEEAVTLYSGLVKLGIFSPERQREIHEMLMNIRKVKAS